MGPATGLALAHALAGARRLRSLGLGFNRLGTDATLALAGAASSAPALADLGLENTCAAGAENDVSEAAARANAARRAAGLEPARVVYEFPPRVRNVVSRERVVASRGGSRHVVENRPARMMEKLKPLELAPQKPQTPKVLKRRRWRLPTSIWRARPRECDSRTFFDVDRFLKKAALADLLQTRLEQLLHGDHVEFKHVAEVFTVHYRNLRLAFKHYACVGDDQPFSIQWNEWRAFGADAGLVGDGCDVEDLDTIFIAANVELGAKTRGNPGKALTRYEFLECVYRVAQKRHGAPRGDAPAPAPHEALKALLDDDFLPHARDGPQEYLDLGDDYRRTRLYGEEVENALRRHEATVDKMFDAYAKVVLDMGAAPVVDFDDARRLVEALDLFEDDGFSLRHCNMAFVFSQMTVKDRMGSSKHRYLSKTDFLEFLCRVADYKVRGPGPEFAGGLDDVLDAFFADLEYPKPKRPGEQPVRTFVALDQDGG